jgi:hypothetical protein
MCGIAGISNLTPITRRMIPHILWDIETRGRDSWSATDGTSLIKHLGPATLSYAGSADEIDSWDRVILHTRAASTGAVTLENQHPFRFDRPNPADGHILGIHNGIVGNHLDLKIEHNRDFEVDSMHIFAHIAAGLDTKDICGWGNLAWYDFCPDFPSGVLRLLRFNSEALHIATLLTGELIFCSTKETIFRAAAMAGGRVDKFLTIHDETLYTIRQDETGTWQCFFRTGEKMPFGPKTSYVSSDYRDWNNYSYTPHQNTIDLTGMGSSHRNRPTRMTFALLGADDRKEGICAVRACKKQVVGSRRQALICPDHVMEVMKSL